MGQEVVVFHRFFFLHQCPYTAHRPHHIRIGRNHQIRLGFFCPADKMLNRILRQHVITVNKPGIRPVAKGHAMVPSLRNPGVFLMHNADPVVLGCFPIQYFGSAILAAVVHHNDLQLFPGLPLHALQAPDNGILPIPHGDHHAHQGLIHAITPYSPLLFQYRNNPRHCTLCVLPCQPWNQKRKIPRPSSRDDCG